MKNSLIMHTATKYLAGIIAVGALIFLPAGTLRYWNGWLLMAILFLPMLALGIAMLLRSPELLRKRINAKEASGEERLLEDGLQGYNEYKTKVKYRLIPFIW